MEVERIVREAFIREWGNLVEEKTLGSEYRDYQELLLRSGFNEDYLKQIAQNFNLRNVQIEIEHDLREAKQKEIKVLNKYYRATLRSLARQYAIYLYETSMQGRQLDTDTIRKAKEILKGKKGCKVYPC